MAANSVYANSIVPEVLNDENYKIWSSCMKSYLLGQDLWHVIISEPETASSSSDSSKNVNAWTKKNAMALHAIQMSCGTNFLSQIAEVESAKDAWNLLKSITNHKGNSKIEADQHDNTIDEYYAPFIKAAKDGDLSTVEKFVHSDRQVLTAKVFEQDGTALHQVLRFGHVKIAEFLVDLMTPPDMEIQDKNGFTVLGVAALYCPSMSQIVRRMISKNRRLPNIGYERRIPVIKAAAKGYKDSTRFLYSVTDKNIMSPRQGKVGTYLLLNCIGTKIFDVALDLLKQFPELILVRGKKHDAYPILALARTPSISVEHDKPRLFNQWLSKCGAYLDILHLQGDKNMDTDQKLIHDQALAILRFVCNLISTFDVKMMKEAGVRDAMFIAAKIGNIEFITEMIRANPSLLRVTDEDNKTIFWYAVQNRQEKVFNLIYGINASREFLLSSRQDKDHNNILHLSAILAPSPILDRTSGAALQMQRELQWFNEVQSLVKPRYKEDLNKEGVTPRKLFSKSHKKLVKEGERWMKETAESSTFTSALIVTIMFSAAFTVPGGLVFLGILTARYAEDDFLVSLPRRLMIGLCSLFFSIANMMVAFSTALAIMLDGQLQFILPVVLLACIPVILFLSSILPLLFEIYMSTFGSSIFDKNTKLPSKKEDNKKMINHSGAQV